MSATFTKIAAGAYRSTNLVPVEIHKTGAGSRPWIVCVIGNSRSYTVEQFPTLADAKSYALPLINHPQGVAVAAGWVDLAARKLEGFGGHARARRHSERMAAYLTAWRARRYVNNPDAPPTSFLSAGTEAAFCLMPAREGGDGFPYFVDRPTYEASLEEAARELGIDLDPSTPLSFRASLVEESRKLASEAPTSYPCPACGSPLSIGSPASMCGCRERDGVVIDEHTNARLRELAEADAEAAKVREAEALAMAAGYSVSPRNTSEEGPLYFVVFDGDVVESCGGWASPEGAWMEAADRARLVSLPRAMRDAVETMRGNCPAAADYAAAVFDGGSLVEMREARPKDRNSEAEYAVSRATILGSIARDYSGTAVVVVDVEAQMYDDANELPRASGVDVIAAKIAAREAESFSYDDDSEDVRDAAQRAADILRDLDTSDVPAFLRAVFGVPMEDREAVRELQRWQQFPGTREDWKELQARKRIEVGTPDVARWLVYDHADVLAARAFEGHDQGNGIVSTNLSAWQEARAAFAAVNELAGHTFGGYCLDGHQGTCDMLAERTLDAAAEAVRYAADNALHGEDYAGMIETGMPRAE